MLSNSNLSQRLCPCHALGLQTQWQQQQELLKASNDLGLLLGEETVAPIIDMLTNFDVVTKACFSQKLNKGWEKVIEFCISSVWELISFCRLTLNRELSVTCRRSESPWICGYIRGPTACPGAEMFCCPFLPWSNIATKIHIPEIIFQLSYIHVKQYESDEKKGFFQKKAFSDIQGGVKANLKKVYI